MDGNHAPYDSAQARVEASRSSGKAQRGREFDIQRTFDPYELANKQAKRDGRITGLYRKFGGQEYKGPALSRIDYLFSDSQPFNNPKYK